jgi:hypothetical protein
MLCVTWLVWLMLAACGGSGSAADAQIIPGCGVACVTSATCGGFDCIGGSCNKECHSGGECPTAPGATFIAECSTYAAPDDAAPGTAYCAGGCPP